VPRSLASGAANPVDRVVPAPIIAAISRQGAVAYEQGPRRRCLVDRGCRSLPVLLDGHKVDALRAGQREKLGR
jgi:hypothetical protein